MSHGLKALLLAASTIITCIIVGLGFSMAREAKQIGNYMVDDLHQYRIAIEEQDYTKYDGATVYGNDVVNLMKRELTEAENGFCITVESDGMIRTYKKAGDIALVQEYGSVHYIAPAEEYVGKVLRNENEVITEIGFRKKETEEKE